MRREDDTGRRLDESLHAVDARLDRVESAIDRRRAAPVADATVDRTAEAGAATHVLFTPSASGYELVERDGALPATGETIELVGLEGRYRVVKVARSPLPGDRRPCAYLELT